MVGVAEVVGCRFTIHKLVCGSLWPVMMVVLWCWMVTEALLNVVVHPLSHSKPMEIRA